MTSTVRDVTIHPPSRNNEFNAGAEIYAGEVYCGEKDDPVKIAGYDDGYDSKEHPNER